MGEKCILNPRENWKVPRITCSLFFSNMLERACMIRVVFLLLYNPKLYAVCRISESLLFYIQNLLKPVQRFHFLRGNVHVMIKIFQRLKMYSDAVETYFSFQEQPLPETVMKVKTIMLCPNSFPRCPLIHSLVSLAL